MSNNFERTKPLVSVIIPSWFTINQSGKYGEAETFWFASECLHRLLKVTNMDEVELIIIDNGSTLTDSLALTLDRDFVYSPSEYWSMADILIRNKKNLGFAPACNQGFELARGDYVCCLNNDVLVWSGWIEALLSVFETGDLTPPPGVVMPGLEKTHKDARDALLLEKPNLKDNFNKTGPKAEFGSLWVSRKSILDELKQQDGHVFDEGFIVGFGEDRDLWERIRGLGLETYRTHKTRVFHQGCMSMSKVQDKKKYTDANRERLWKRYPHRIKKKK